MKTLYNFLFDRQLDFAVYFPDDGSGECDSENPLLNGKKGVLCNNRCKNRAVGWNGWSNSGDRKIDR